MLEIEKLAKKDQKKLSLKERRRVKEYLKRKARIPPFDQKCKVCGKPIPKPFEVCSSKCRDEYEQRNKQIREEKSKRTQRTLEEVTEDYR